MVSRFTSPQPLTLSLGENQPMIDQTTISLLAERPPFATIQIGTFGSGGDLRKALLDGGYRISGDANDILGRISVAPKPTVLDLYRVTNTELGLPPCETLSDEAFKAIRKIGGEKLTAEVGPQYRLQMPGQTGECMLIYMDPIRGSNGVPLLFGIENCEDGLWLRGCRGPQEVCSAVRIWMFSRRRK